MHIIKNNKLKIAIKNTGAELCEISSVKNKTHFLWGANPAVWGSYAPNLFPIIGALKENTYIFKDEEYKLPKHGFVRHNEDIVLHQQTENSLTFKLTYNEQLLKIYPFKFEFFLTFTLLENTIIVSHTINNIDNKTMYFSVGGHPAFKCPIYENEEYTDYTLEFEQLETAKKHLINMGNGLISPKTEKVFLNSNKIQLTHDLFNEDALVFKDLKSRKVTLKSKTHGNILTVIFKEFPYLGIWAKPQGDFVCIEPWLGIADSETSNQKIEDKEGIISLLSGNIYKASYKIEIHNSHLV